jgi:hypothetical protein
MLSVYYKCGELVLKNSIVFDEKFMCIRGYIGPI